MNSKKYKVVRIVSVMIMFVATSICLAKIYHEYYAVITGPVLITLLVVHAMCSADTQLQDEDKLDSSTLDDNALKALITFYDEATRMHIGTDRGMYQIVGIYVPASLLVLGWIITNPEYSQLKAEFIALIGSAAIVLVGVATLIKHRLRYYNKIREEYLRKLEDQFLESGYLKVLGLHHFVKNQKATGVSFHAIIDIYYFLHMGVWIVIWFSKI